MKREEKNALSRRKILDAALEEFSEKGYEGASLNAVCANNKISKGLIYHYFKDKDELYLQCVAECFDAMTECLREKISAFSGSVEEKIRIYFDERLRFFAENPMYLGIFADVSHQLPASLTDGVLQCRREFDELNISVLTDLLNSRPLRKGLTVDTIVEDFRLYMDYFNMRFKMEMRENSGVETLLRNHEERCHRQLDILLHGVIDD